MSFSDKVKNELNSIKIKNSCCRRAYIFGALMSAKLQDGNVHIFLTNESCAENLSFFISRVFHTEVERKSVNRGFCNMTDISFYSPIAYKFITDCIKCEENECTAIQALFGKTSCQSCRSTFIRGLICASATFSDPKKSYSAEITLPDKNRALQIKKILNDSSIYPGFTENEKRCRLFLKNGSAVEDILSLCGASQTVFDIYNSQIEHDIRNNENRATNCVAKNIQRSVNASVKQKEAINALIVSGHFDKLPDELKITANLRHLNPEMSMSELAQMHTPRISKSGLNHRLVRIVEEAQKFGLI